MSATESIVYGYGFELSITPVIFIKWIKKHKTTFCESADENALFEQLVLNESSIDDDVLSEVFCHYYCNSSSNEGVGAAISNIMSRETGIRFDYQPGQEDCGGSPHILMVESMPWELNEIEKSLTQDKLDNIMISYMRELSLSGEPGKVALEYYG